MADKEIYREIKQSIASGEIASLPKEKLVQFQAALAHSHARLHLGAQQFPQICSTVDLHLAAALAKEPNPTSKPPENPTNPPREWHDKPLGKLWLTVVGGVLLLCAAYLLRSHLGLPL
jgi:hypothetical protein